MNTEIAQTTVDAIGVSNASVDVISQLNNSSGRQYLTFRLSGQDFGVDILKVQEIKNCSAITPIPNTPPHVMGAMNLRGTVVPIIDLRVKFGMPEADYNQYTVIVVVNVGSRVLGLVVDAVSDVLNVAEDEFESSPDFGPGTDTTFISGLAKTGERITTLLNLEKLVGSDQLD